VAVVPTQARGRDAACLLSGQGDIRQGDEIDTFPLAVDACALPRKGGIKTDDQAERTIVGGRER
jgi:hypothetical protein